MGVFSLRRDSDEAVIRRVLAGQRDEFGILVCRYLPAVHAVGRARIGNPADAQDVAQETFLKAYLSLDTLREPGRFGAWLLSIARNMAHNLQRSESRRAEREVQSVFPPQPPAPENIELQHVLQAQLAALEEPAREILMLHYYAGKSTKELADLLGISRDAVKKRLQRARETLGERMLRELKPTTEPPEEQRRNEARIIAAIATSNPSWTAVLPAAGLWASFGIAAALKTAAVLAALGAGIGWWSHSDHNPGKTTTPFATTASTVPPAKSIPPTKEATPVVPTPSLSAAPNTVAVSASPTTGTIEGRIYDAERHTGISAVDMVFKGAGKQVVVTSDAEGRFRAADLPPGTYTVGRDFAPLKGYSNRGVGEEQSVVLNAGAVLSVDCPLSQGTVIAGRVTDEAGTLLDGVQLMGITNQENRWRDGQSELDGSFVIPGFEGPGRGFQVYAKKTGYAMKPLDDLTVPAGGLHDLTLVMLPESTVSGTVVDADGNPLKDVGVDACVPGKGSVYGMGTSVFTDDHGIFSLPGLYPSRYSIIITDPGVRIYALDNTAAEVEIGRDEHVKDLVLVSKWRRGLAITGRVLYSDGRPVDFARVSVKGDLSGGQTKQDGAYRIDGLEAGSYEVTAVADIGPFPSQRLTQENVPAGSGGVDFVFDAPVEVRGTVVDAESGLPITDFEVTRDMGIKPQMDRGVEWQYRRFQDQSGSFTLNEQPPGDITLYARAAGYAQQFVHVKAKPGKTLDNAKIALSHGVTIEGVVRNRAGEPLSGARIYLGPIPEQQHRSRCAVATAGPQGQFTVHVRPGGPQILSAWHTDHAPAAVSVPLADKTVRTEIVLGDGGGIEGTVTQDSEPLTGQTVVAYAGETHSDTATTDDAGHFRIDRILPGDVALNVYLKSESNSRFLRQSAVVRDGAVTTVELTAPSGTAAIEGAKDLGGNTGQVVLQIPLANGTSLNVSTARDKDTYSFTGLPAGPATLKVTAWDEVAKEMKEIQSYDVTLVEGQTLRQDVQVP